MKTCVSRTVRAGLLALALATAAGSAAADDFANDFRVDLAKYAGLWHEVARTPNWFEDNRPRHGGKRFSACFASTAEYAPLGPARISVRNACLRRAADGTRFEDVAEGSATVVEGSDNRKLQVVLGPGVARFFQRLVSPSDGNYWIYCLGPEISGRYAWSVVGDKGKTFIFMLARTPRISAEQRSEMLRCARKSGLPVEKLITPQAPE